MAPRNEDVRTALEMIPINVLRNIIDERDIDFTSRASDKLIDKLVEDGWSDIEFEQLKKRLRNIQLEKEPYSRYVAELKNIEPQLGGNPEHERIKHLLSTNMSDFDDDNQLVEPGFEISTVESEQVDGLYWTESVNYTLTPQDKIKKQQTLYETGFEIDLDQEVVFIDCSRKAKAKGLLSRLGELGIHTDPVGHAGVVNSQANELVQSFINEFERKLIDNHSQRSVASDDPHVLEVDLVNLLLDEANLEDIKIGGRTDILDHEEVQRFREEHDSRIVRLEGEFLHNDDWYAFKTGYADDMGQVSVKKKGYVEEKPELVKDAFELLFEYYDDHFIDI